MPYMDPFSGIVTTTKRNNRYRGPTESEKVSPFLGEVSADLITLYAEIDAVRTNLDLLASGYLVSSEIGNYMGYLKGAIYDMESKINARIYTQASQEPVE